MSLLRGPILVTGATGNVGREVLRALAAAGLPRRAGVRAPAGLGDVPAVALDFARPETFDAALVGCSGLFLVRPPAVADVKRTLNVLVDRAALAGVEHVVFLSVEGADRQAWVPHHAVERHLLASGLRWTLLRPGFFAQNLGDAYRRDLRERSELIVPAGRGRVAFVDVRDVAEVAALAFARPELRQQAWTLTGPEALSFDEVAGVLGAALGRPVRYRAASVPGYALHLRRQGLPGMQVLVQTLLHVGIRFGNAAQVDPALGRLLGRRPRSLADYVKDHAALWDAAARP